MPGRNFAILVSAALVVWGVVSSWRLAAQTTGLDFYQFWIGGQEAPQERGGLWSPEARLRLGGKHYQSAITSGESERLASVAQSRRELELFSTPFLYTCFGALPKRYELAYLIWRIIGLVSLIAAIALMARALGWHLAPALFFLAFVLLLFQPLKSELRVGNVNGLQLLMIAAYFVTPAVVRGAVLGVAIAFKPNIAIALPLVIAYDLAHDRRVLAREMAGVVAGGAAAVAISSAYFRSATAWIDWLHAARSLSTIVYPREIGNVAPALSLGSDAWVLAAVLTIAAIVLVVRGHRVSPELAISVGLLVYLMTASLVWLHYLLLAIPLGMILLGSSSMLVQGVAGAAMTFIAADPWEVLLRTQSEREEATLIAIGLIGLAVAAIVHVWPFSSAKWLRKT